MRQPFGEESCEHEVEVLGAEYRDYYFDETQFNDQVLRTHVYLIIGRRGSGKTSIAEHFKFQKVLPNAICVDVNEPEAYDAAVRAMRRAPETMDPAQLAAVWEYVIWSLIFSAFRHANEDVDKACRITTERRTPSRIVRDLIRNLVDTFLQDDGSLRDDAEDTLQNPVVEKARHAALAITQDQPIIVAFDTLEQYDISDAAMLKATAALVMAASRFNQRHATKGIHVKMFLGAEIAPHLIENVIVNPTKFAREPVYLHWRPKDLLRFISWRFFRFLRHSGIAEIPDVDWNDFRQVLETIWVPYFGHALENGFGQEERTFPYVLRHTQLRPRELVVLCNKIARLAQERGSFPRFSPDVIREGIRDGESDLAVGVISSYARVYPQAGNILRRAFTNQPVVFKGSDLDRFAPSTASLWPKSDGFAGYSREAFKRLVFELGVVGRVRQYDPNKAIVAADFEYAMREPLSVRDDELCVIHPMFVGMLRPNFPRKLRIYPFPGPTDIDILG